MKNRIPGLNGIVRFLPGLHALIIRPGTLAVILGCYAVVFLVSLVNRFIQIDENWFGEQGYWLVHEGVVRLRSMPGILDFDRQMYVYHKLLVWMGAGMTAIFGWSVFPLKFLTLAFYLLFFPVFYRYWKNNRGQLEKRHFLLAATLLVLAPILFEQSFTFRPEVFVMTLGFISYFFIDKYLKSNRLVHASLAGLFAGLAFLITLNGMIFPIAGAVLLLIMRKWKGLAAYLPVCVAVCLLFLVDLTGPGRLQGMFYQLEHWPTRKFGETYMVGNAGEWILGKLINLLNEQERFFWSDRVMAFSILFVLAFAFNFKYLYRNFRSLFIYTVTLILALNFTGSHIAERYLIFYFPFMALVSAAGMLGFERKNMRYLRFVYPAVFLFLLFSVGKRAEFVFARNEDSARIHAEVLSHIPETSRRVFAPWRFIFNGIDRYNILCYQALEYYQDDLPQKMDQVTATRLLRDRYGVAYLVLDRDITRDREHAYDWFRGGPAAGNPMLEVIYRDDSHILCRVR